MSGARNYIAAYVRSMRMHFGRSSEDGIPSIATLWPDLPWGGRLYDQLPLRHERVRIRDHRGRPLETSIAYREHFGERSQAPLLVCIPGLGDSSHTYRILLEALAPRYRVVLIDPPGFGASEVQPTRSFFTAETMLHGIREFLVQRHLNRPGTILVGNSLGGALSMGICASLGRRNRIGHVVLLSPCAYPQPLTFWIGLQRLPFHAAVASLVPRFYLSRTVLWDSVGDARCISREAIEDLQQMLGRPWGLRSFMFLCRDISRLCRGADHGKNNLLTSLVSRFRRTTRRLPDGSRGPIRALILHGDRDIVVPRWVPERLEEELANSRRLLVEGMGHLPQQERPRLVASEIDRFLLDETSVAIKRPTGTG